MMIESRQNPTVKRLEKLHEAKGRKEQERFLIDTPRDMERALKRGVKIVAGYWCREFPRQEEIEKLLQANKIPMTEMSQGPFEAICYRENPGGIVLEAESWPTRLEEVKIKNPTLVVVAEDIEKPGNLGTLLRTADAVGAGLVLGCNATVELFNPNTIRSSAGAAFVVPYATATLEEALVWIKKHQLKLVAAAPAAPKSLWQANLKMPVALAVGSEDEGLSEKMLKAADEMVSLPMKGVGDSLNVSVACGAMLYEVLRQREQQK